MLDDYPVRNEVSRAIQCLGVPKCDFKLLGIRSAIDVHRKVVEAFCAHGPGLTSKTWLWEHFNKNLLSACWSEGGIRRVSSLIPSEDHCFMLTEGESKLMPFWIYKVKCNMVSKVLEECYGFEYYLVGTRFDWLICENHHDTVVAIGNKVVV